MKALKAQITDRLAPLLGPYIDRGRAWYERLSVRERAMVGAGVVFVIASLIYGLVWAPLDSGVERLSKTVAQQRQDLAWMKKAAPKARQLAASGPPQAAASGRSLMAVVDQRINSAGLKNSLERMEPDGSDTVKLWLQAAAFDQLITVLGQLDQQAGVRVERLDVTPVDEAGRVDAKLTLARGGA